MLVSVSSFSQAVAGSVVRTSHELEGHGHALLVVRHICGISRGVRLGGVGELAGLAVLCWAVVCDRERLKVVEEEAGSGTCESQASTGSCDSRLQAQESIPLIDQNTSFSTLPLTHTFTMQSTRAFNMLRQRAAPVFRAQQPVRGLRLQSSPKMRSPVPVRTREKDRHVHIPMLTTSQKEEHSGSFPPP
jgi:hypothetical protein